MHAHYIQQWSRIALKRVEDGLVDLDELNSKLTANGDGSFLRELLELGARHRPPPYRPKRGRPRTEDHE